MTRDELLDLITSTRGELDALYVARTGDELVAPVLAGGWTMKDVMAHVAAWERRLLNAVAAAERGEDDVWPEPGYTVSVADTERLNQRDYLAARDRPLDDVRADAQATYDDFMRWVRSFTDEQVAGELAYTPGLKLEWLIRAQADQHYRHHIDAIKAASAS
jgi:hypothetical protein